MTLAAVLMYFDELARAALNVPRREIGSDDCSQERLVRPCDLEQQGEFERWIEEREFGNPVG